MKVDLKDIEKWLNKTQSLVLKYLAQNVDKQTPVIKYPLPTRSFGRPWKRFLIRVSEPPIPFFSTSFLEEFALRQSQPNGLALF